MEHTKATPKDFFLWAGAMVALYGAVVAFIGLLFDYINYALPNTLDYYYGGNPYQGSVAYEMASLIVLAPLCLILMRIIRRGIAQDASRAEVWVRRWALFLTLFIAGATIAIDLIVLITTFLNGEELTAAFLLKVLVVLLVAGAGFMHFIADLWGYWIKNPGLARMVTWAVAVLIVLSIVSGFFIIGSPSQARQQRLDDQRVQDLQMIQSEVINYWQKKGELPPSLSALNDPLSYFTLPKDPATGADYEYENTTAGAPSFELCATFATASRPQPSASYAKPNFANENWSHPAGHACFNRVIDSDLYPILRD